MPDATLKNAPTACDPVTLEIVRGAVRAAQAEMEALIERTAISAFIREKKDFYTALFDADGVHRFEERPAKEQLIVQNRTKDLGLFLQDHRWQVDPLR